MERKSGSKRKIAEVFGVHESFLDKLLRQKRERGDVAPLPHGGGASAKLSAEHLRQLPDLVAATPDATLDERREQIILPSLGLMAAGMFVLAGAASGHMFNVAAVLCGSGVSLLVPTLMAYTIEQVSIVGRGWAIGMFTAAMDLSMACGAIVSGLILHLTAAYPFVFAASGGYRSCPPPEGEVMGATCDNELSSPVAATGQEGRSAKATGGYLRLVHRRV